MSIGSTYGILRSRWTGRKAFRRTFISRSGASDGRPAITPTRAHLTRRPLRGAPTQRVEGLVGLAVARASSSPSTCSVDCEVVHTSGRTQLQHTSDA